jgi:hypothetical protein
MSVCPHQIAISAVIAVLVWLLPVRAGADALVWSQAMLASTIAEPIGE